VQVFLETDRLMLRRFTAADESNLFELNSDPEVMRFLTGGKPTPRDEVRTRIIPAFLGYYERFAGFGFWAVVETLTGQFLGWFHFRPPLRGGGMPADWDEDGVIELGYRLRRAAWGKGYATEGSLALIDKGFTEFGVRRVVAETTAGNRGSRRVLEKSGLTQTAFIAAPGPAGAGGDDRDIVVYELSRAEWETRRAEGRRAAR
jgi:RimJ/RimL family protein N-acetyltransferase